MAVGEGALISGKSYLAVGRETALGTYNTCTAQLDFISCSLKTMQENKILEQIERSRTYSKRISMGKSIEGDLEFYFYPRVSACNYILQNAFGGTVTSATTSGETTGGGGFDHTFEIGCMDQSWPSMCLNYRRGDSTTGKVTEYSGIRVNEISFSAELDEALKCSASLVGFDSSSTSNDVEGALSASAALPLSFVNGRVSVESSFSSLTSTSFWEVQSVEFGISNSLKSDADSRRIGSNILQTLPPGIATFSLNLSMRFDTTTALDAMLNETQLAVQLEFLGPTMSGSVAREGIKFNFPKVYISDAGQPEIGGPDEILKSEVVMHVLRDDSSNTGYAVQAVVTNDLSSI